MTERLEAEEGRNSAGRTAPRVTLSDVKNNIAEEHYVLGLQAISAAGGISEHQSADTLTICILVTQSGFCVVGKSAPASVENFDAGLGRTLAYEDAVRQLWPLMGYALRQQLSEQGAFAELND